jgi:hypothetical protein
MSIPRAFRSNATLFTLTLRRIIRESSYRLLRKHGALREQPFPSRRRRRGWQPLRESTRPACATLDPEQAKSAVLNRLTYESGQQTYGHAIAESVEWNTRLQRNRFVPATEEKIHSRLIKLSRKGCGLCGGGPDRRKNSVSVPISATTQSIGHNRAPSHRASISGLRSTKSRAPRAQSRPRIGG